MPTTLLLDKVKLRIIGSSAKEVKSIIEEAAGIKKFQGQKNEAIKNLSNVDLELEKINLILSEVGERKQKVEKQVGSLYHLF